MAEYTPTTGEIRYRVEHDWEPYGDGSFDRWLAQHDAELRAEIERLREDYRAACEARMSFHDDLDEAQRQVTALREDLDFERGRCARLAGLADKAERQVADLRAFASWLVSLDDDNPDSPGRQERRTVTLSQIIDRARVALAGPGEQPGETTIPEACDGGADPTLNHEQHPWPCGDATALRPAPVVPDSADVRERVREVIRLSKIADPAWVSKRTFDEFDGLVEEVADAVLAVVGQGVTDCNCGFGGQHDPANPRCRANRAERERDEARARSGMYRSVLREYGVDPDALDAALARGEGS